MLSKGLNASDQFQRAETGTGFLGRVFAALKPGFAAPKTSAAPSTIALQSALLNASQQIVRIQRRIDREVQICRMQQHKVDALNRWYSCETQADLVELGYRAAGHIQALNQSHAKIRELKANKQAAIIYRDELQGQLGMLSPAVSGAIRNG